MGKSEPRDSVLGDAVYSALSGSLSRRGARLPLHDRIHYFPRGADRSRRDRPLSFHCPDFDIEISQTTPGDQGLARQTISCSPAFRHRHPDEPRAPLGRATFHRARARSREAADESEMITPACGTERRKAMSAYMSAIEGEADSLYSL